MIYGIVWAWPTGRNLTNLTAPGAAVALPGSPGGGLAATSRPEWASPSAPPTASSPISPRPGTVVEHKDGRRNRDQIQARHAVS